MRRVVPHIICGFFTLSSATIQIEELSKSVSPGIPRYRAMPALVLGRMAIDDHCRGLDLDTVLIREALRCCLALRDSVGFVTLVVDAKTPELARYYEAQGFSRFPHKDLPLYIMLDTMAQIIEESELG